MVTPATFTGLEIITAVAFAVPLALDLLHLRLLPAVVFEVLAGILIGPYGLNWVTADEPVQIFSFIGLGFLLFLAGMEVDTTRFRGPLFRLSLLCFGGTVALALFVGLLFGVTGLVRTPLFFANILVATSLGVILPPLKSAGEVDTTFGQLSILAATLAEFGSLVLLTVLFSTVVVSTPVHVFFLACFVLLAVVVIAVVLRAERSKTLTRMLVRLSDSTAQIRVRGAWALLAAFVALAVQGFGLSIFLGAFIAGVVIHILDPDETTRHPQFRMKLDAIGFGVFIPVFFVTIGLQFDLPALTSSTRALVLVPLFLLALLVVHTVPALLFRPLLGNTRTYAAGFLQATSLTFILVAVQIGSALHLISAATSAALTAASLFSILIFPFTAMLLLRRANVAESQQAALAQLDERTLRSENEL
ncbi:MAG TPA: cation:proton antiporter [Ktedonobacterales bacterium]|jgi:Kef-type K+ transport system membrane component KefB